MFKKLLLAVIISAVVSSTAWAWSGREIWRVQAGASITTDIVFDEGVIYAGDELGIVYALNAGNGNQLWFQTINGTVVGKPVIIGGLVICAGRNGVLCAFNKKNGNVVWRHQPDREDGGIAFEDGPAAGGGKVFIGDGSGILRAINAANGVLSWTWKTSMALFTAPLYSNGIVYAGEQNALFSAIDANTGKKLWGGGAGGAINTPAVNANKGYVYFSSEDGTLTSVSIKDKGAVWRTFAGAPISTAPEIYNGRIFAGTAIGDIIALSEESGDVLWITGIGGGNVNAKPIAADGILFAGSGDGTLYAIEMGSGQVRWSSKLGPEINGAACFNNGILYAGSSTGEIAAFR